MDYGVSRLPTAVIFNLRVLLITARSDSRCVSTPIWTVKPSIKSIKHNSVWLPMKNRNIDVDHAVRTGLLGPRNLSSYNASAFQRPRAWFANMSSCSSSRTTLRLIELWACLLKRRIDFFLTPLSVPTRGWRPALCSVGKWICQLFFNALRRCCREQRSWWEGSEPGGSWRISVSHITKGGLLHHLYPFSLISLIF